MMAARSNVVISARVIDPLTQAEIGEWKTVQPVEHLAEDEPWRIVEFALELADPVNEWRELERSCPGCNGRRYKQVTTVIPGNGSTGPDATGGCNMTQRLCDACGGTGRLTPASEGDLS